MFGKVPINCSHKLIKVITNNGAIKHETSSKDFTFQLSVEDTASFRATPRFYLGSNFLYILCDKNLEWPGNGSRKIKIAYIVVASFPGSHAPEREH